MHFFLIKYSKKLKFKQFQHHMNVFLSSILRPYQKIVDQGDEDGNIPHDVLMPLISISDFEKLCLYASDHFSSQDTILSVPSETYVVGDLHGNILDLLRILRFVGDITQTRILFLGDYVDRGQFSIEVVTLLFCLACLFPENILMIRGNHEFRKVNESYGFKHQIIEAFKSESPWEKANSAFDCLPIAAIIDNKIFCVHGGITPAVKKITELSSKYTRPICNCDDEILYDLMWGDPTTSTQSYTPSLRGIGNQFGSFALNQFLDENGFIQMIRGHQCVHDGFQRLFKNRLITVFSSSNYGEIANGKAGFLFVCNDLNSKNYILYPYAIVIDRKDTHFVPINTKSLLNLPSTNIPQIPLAHSMSKNSLTTKVTRSTARTINKLPLGQYNLLKPRVKRHSLGNLKMTFETPLY